MKIRNGFVSNSSSTSFCVYGTTVNIDLIIEKVAALPNAPENIAEKYGPDSDNDYDYELIDEGMELIGKQLQQVDKRFYWITDFDNHQVYIGISPTDILDDETGAQFKSKVWDGLYEVLRVSSTECHMLVEEIYN